MATINYKKYNFACETNINFVILQAQQYNFVISTLARKIMKDFLHFMH